MAYVGIRPGRSEGMRLVCFVEYSPGPSQQEKPSEDHHVAEQMEWVQVRITFPAHKRFQEMTSVVREQVDTRKNTSVAWSQRWYAHSRRTSEVRFRIEAHETTDIDEKGSQARITATHLLVFCT